MEEPREKPFLVVVVQMEELGEQVADEERKEEYMKKHVEKKEAVEKQLMSAPDAAPLETA